MNGITQFVTIVFTGISAMAFFPILEIFFPKYIQELREIEEASLKRAFWIGVVNVIFFAALAMLFNFLVQNTGIQLMTILIFILGIVFIGGTFLGLTSTIQIISDKLFPDQSLLKKKAYGAGITVLACLFPYVGWFGLLSFLVFISFGSFMIRTMQRKPIEVKGKKNKK